MLFHLCCLIHAGSALLRRPWSSQDNNFSISFYSVFQDDDWQEEHKRLAELDEKDGLCLGGAGLGAELGDCEDSSNSPSSAKQHPLPSSLPLPNFSTFTPDLPLTG